MKVNWQTWHQFSNIDPIEFICGYCGKHIGSHIGFFNTSKDACKIYICSYCGMPTLIYDNSQYPGPLLGRVVQNLPQDIETIYKEIKDSIKNSSYTGSILLGRKLIMHLAVNIAKAPEGKTFVGYIDYLKQSGYIPPNGEKILVFIKDLGNEKNHEIKIGKKEEAEKMLKFIEVLLIFIYEFPLEVSGETTQV